MSSNQTHHRTFWCHECDMSVHLLSPSAAAAVDPPPLCPHCHYQNLELMDDATPTAPASTTDINTSFLDSPSFRQFFLPFFGDFFPSDDDDSDFDSFLDSILPTIKITDSFFDADDPESLLLCAVCKEQFVVDVEAKLLPCNHLFHPECILPWLNLNHNSCPLCRFQLPSASKLDVSTSESSSQYSFSQLRESRSSVDCNGGLEVGFTHQDDLDCGFPDVGVLSSFLPSHF